MPSFPRPDTRPESLRTTLEAVIRYLEADLPRVLADLDRRALPTTGKAGQVLVRQTAMSVDAAFVDPEVAGSSPVIPTFPLAAASVNTVVTSDPVTVSGDPRGAWPVIVTGDGDPQVQVDGAVGGGLVLLGGGLPPWSRWATVRAGDQIRVRLTSAPSPSTERRATLHAPGVSVEFSVTT